MPFCLILVGVVSEVSNSSAFVMRLQRGRSAMERKAVLALILRSSHGRAAVRSTYRSGSNVAFGKLRPEVLFAIPGTDEVAVLSDDGEEKIEGFACKDKELPGEKKSFRGITLMLPMVLAATPTSSSGSYYTVSKQHRTRRRPITNARVFSQNDEYTKTAWLPAFFYSRKRKDIYANHGQLG